MFYKSALIVKIFCAAGFFFAATSMFVVHKLFDSVVSLSVSLSESAAESYRAASLSCHSHAGSNGPDGAAVGPGGSSTSELTYGATERRPQ